MLVNQVPNLFYGNGNQNVCSMCAGGLKIITFTDWINACDGDEKHQKTKDGFHLKNTNLGINLILEISGRRTSLNWSQTIRIITILSGGIK